MTKPPVTPPKLRKAVEIFKELGWYDAKISDAPTLPLGTPEQQELVVKGLEKGAWEKWVDDSYSGTTYDLVQVSHTMLALFAIRCGVSAKRAVWLLDFAAVREWPTAVQCVLQRGPKYVRDVMAGIEKRDRWGDDTSVGAWDLCMLSFLLIVDDYGLDFEVPAYPRYLRDWAGIVAYAFYGREGAYFQGEVEQIPPKETLLRSMRAHVEMAVEQGVPLWGALGYVLRAGLENGVFTRKEVVDYAVAAVNAPARPSEHKRCVELLCADLAITDDEIRAHAETLGALISSGDAVLIDAVGARFFAVAAAAQTTEVAVGALYASTQKAQVVVLQGLAARGDLTEELLAPLAPRLQELAGVRNKQIVKLATGLLNQAGEQPEPATPLNEMEAPAVTWVPVPPVWEVERFEVEHVDVDALVAAQQATSPDKYDSGPSYDIELEQFFAILVALAQTDFQSAQRYIDSQTDHDAPYIRTVGSDPVGDRGFAVWYNVGSFPVLLSQPSFVDLRITPEDFFARLETYRLAGVPVSSRDLLLALCRLDVRGHDLHELIRQVNEFALPMRWFGDEEYPGTVADVVAEYLGEEEFLATVWPEAGLIDSNAGFAVPKVLERLVRHGSVHYFTFYEPFIFPLIGDGFFKEFGATGHGTFQGACLAAVARQLARCSTPLSPGIAMNLIAAPRLNAKGKAVGLDEAIRAAWRRGLLVPGVADINSIGWKNPVKSFHGLDEVFRDLAHDGMLALVWPLMNDILVAASKAARPHKGAGEIAELTVELLPSVQQAVEAGVADSHVLELPGIRAFGTKKGSSRLAEAARAAMKLLEGVTPPAAETRVEKPQPRAEFSGEFADLWPENRGEGPARPDSATVTFEEIEDDEDASFWRSDGLFAVVSIPEYPGKAFRKFPFSSIHPWRFHELSNGKTATLHEEHLCFDGSTWQLESAPDTRSWNKEFYPSSEFPDSFLYILCAFLAVPKEPKGAVEELGRQLNLNTISAESMKAVIPRLLQLDFWSPVPLVKVIEKNPSHLPALWPSVTESIAVAADRIDAGESIPKWLNRVLDCAIYHAPILAEATKRGKIPATEWEPLNQIAEMKKKVAAKTKANELCVLLGV